MRPDHLIISAMKCGTSTVCAYLEDHPDTFMLPHSDPNFFSYDENFARGTDWYEALFAEAGDAAHVGEGSNDYTNGARFPDAPARIAAYRPDMRLIYVLRHPVDRIVSAWIQNRANRGDEVPPTLDRAVTDMAEVYVDQSLYWKNLERYRAYFPDDQIHVAFMEDLKTDRDRFFAGICAHLGITPTADVKRPQENVSAGKRIPTETYTRVNALPGMQMLKKVLPARFKTMVKDQVLSSTVQTRPEFSTAARAALLDQLRPDAEAILDYCGRPADFWKWD